MGKISNELNQFFQDNQVFADLINLYVYQGEPVILAEGLISEKETTYPLDAQGKRRELRSDICKKYQNGQSYQLFCLENESKVSYTMPVRMMNYEASRYAEQLRELAASHEKKQYPNWSALSSGFLPNDRLNPVISFVLYWKRDCWNGSRSLLEMMDLPEDDRLHPFLKDYQMNLINMYELMGEDCCRSQLKHILKLLRMDQNKEEMYREVFCNPEYRHLKQETGRVLASLLGSRKLERYAAALEEKEEFNMCKALDDLWMDGQESGRAEGKEEGKIEGRAEGKIEGKAETILDILGETGYVPAALRQRILCQKNLDVLNTWVKLALHSANIEAFMEKM